MASWLVIRSYEREIDTKRGHAIRYRYTLPREMERTLHHARIQVAMTTDVYEDGEVHACRVMLRNGSATLTFEEKMRRICHDEFVRVMTDAFEMLRRSSVEVHAALISIG